MGSGFLWRVRQLRRQAEQCIYAWMMDHVRRTNNLGSIWFFFFGYCWAVLLSFVLVYACILSPSQSCILASSSFYMVDDVKHARCHKILLVRIACVFPSLLKRNRFFNFSHGNFSRGKEMTDIVRKLLFLGLKWLLRVNNR